MSARSPDELECLRAAYRESYSGCSSERNHGDDRWRGGGSQRPQCSSESLPYGSPRNTQHHEGSGRYGSSSGGGYDREESSRDERHWIDPERVGATGRYNDKEAVQDVVRYNHMSSLSGLEPPSNGSFSSRGSSHTGSPHQDKHRSGQLVPSKALKAPSFLPTPPPFPPSPFPNLDRASPENFLAEPS